MTDDAPKGRGGKRGGAGRKPGPHAPYEQRSVNLSRRAWAFISLYGLQTGAKSDNEALEQIIRTHLLFVPEAD